MVIRHQFCELFNFNAPEIEARLKLMDLGVADRAQAKQLHTRIIEPYLQELVDDFYKLMLRKPEFTMLLRHGRFDVDSLKTTQTDYLGTLGKEFYKPVYFDYRLKIGYRHAQIGVTLCVYQSAYRVLQDVLIRKIVSVITDDRDAMSALIRFVIKIANLDMSLAITAYHHSRVDDLEDAISHMKDEHMRLRHQASTDVLTGLPNRDTIYEQLLRDLDAKIPQGGTIHLIMADLDNFKKVNDTHGHLVGDAVLKEIAARLRASLRGTDIVGRYGGEEFIILLKNKQLKTARSIAERIREHVASTPVHVNGLAISLTISQGLAEAHAEDTPDKLVQRADQALYRAKESGRNCVVIEPYAAGS